MITQTATNTISIKAEDNKPDAARTDKIEKLFDYCQFDEGAFEELEFLLS